MTWPLFTLQATQSHPINSLLWTALVISNSKQCTKVFENVHRVGENSKFRRILQTLFAKI